MLVVGHMRDGKLREIQDRGGSEIAAKGLRRIADLYAIKAEIKGMYADNRQAVRATRSPPLGSVADRGEILR